jgi:2-hydroxy-3-keto-5-methylthiopentenyl-1-phosphate phosphatase
VLILCDFDGTITQQDVTNLIWDHFIGPSWRDDLLSAYKRGHISHLKIMVDGYKLVRASKDEILNCVRPQVNFRPGFEKLRQFCEQRGWPLNVVSGGLDLYIEAFLPAGIPFFSYKAARNDHWEVFLPPDVKKDEAEDFKVFVMRTLKKLHRKEKAAFIGDGRNDLPVAKMAEQIFAVRGSTLAKLCAEQNLKCFEFDHFEEIVRQFNSSTS